MRLNFALFYSFLSASAALAGVSYNRILSGASYEYNNNVDTITGTFSIPSTSGQDETGAYFLVGMGGLTNNRAIFGGISLVMMQNKPYYEAFTWLSPDLPYIFSLEINAGDDIRISVNATANAANFTFITIENLTTNLTTNPSTATIDLYIPADHRQIAGCFVADRALLEPTASNVGLADFGVVTFTDVELTASTADVNGPDIAVIQVDDKNLTSVSVDGNSITITRL